jgi:hypothetical protein
MKVGITQTIIGQTLKSRVLIKPPKALEAPYPTSSNKIQTTFGAPLGAFTGSGQYSLESAKVFPITPLNSSGFVCAKPNCARSNAVIKSPFCGLLILVLILIFSLD